MSENKNIINEQEPQDDHMIEGRNAVLEAFRAGKTIEIGRASCRERV